METEKEEKDGLRNKKMEKKPPQHDPDNPPPFWCHICKVAASCPLVLHSHFLGAKHKRAEEALLGGQEGQGEETEKKPQAYESLQEQFDTCQDAEPVLGLEYIYEYKSHGNSRYECRLCNCFLAHIQMFTHIMGNRHRILYLAEHHPELNINNKSVFKKKGKKLKKLREVCVQVEEEFGRKCINVVSDEKEIEEAMAAMAAPPPLPQGLGYKQEAVKEMDFTSDNFMEDGEKPAKEEEEEEEEVVTFRKLKAEYEASQKKRGKARGENLQDTLEGQTGKDQAGEPEKDQKGGLQKCQGGEPDKEQTGGPEDQTGAEKDPEAKNMSEVKRKPVLDAFSGPEEVFAYLQSFEVFELRHIHYLMKVTEKLRGVLDRHQKKMEEVQEEEGSVADAQEEEGSVEEEDNEASEDQETSPVYEDEAGSVVPPEDSVEEPDTEPTAESKQAEELSESQQENKDPLPFLGIKSRPSNQKLSFRISGAPAEKKSLVSSELLSNMQYKFATKGRANKMAASVTRTDDTEVREESDEKEEEESAKVTSTRAAYPHELFENPAGSVSTRASKVSDPGSSFRSGFEDTRDVQEKFPSSEPQPKSKRTDRAGAAPSRGPNEGPAVGNSSRASYLQDRSGNSADSVTSWASNEPFKNVDDVPPSKGPKTKEQKRSSSPSFSSHDSTPYPPHDPTPSYPSYEPISTYDDTWASNEDFDNFDDCPPSTAPNTKKPVRNADPSYPPLDPTRTLASSNEPFRKDGDFPPPKTPNTQEQMRSSASSYPPREPMRTSAGSASTWAMNEPFRNADDFQRSKGPNSRERMRNSAPQNPPHNPTRTPAGSTWPLNEPYKNVGGFLPPPSGPNTHERMRNSAPPYPPHDPKRTSATWASTEPFRNDGFPPQTQDWMRNIPSYPQQEPASSGFPRAPGQPQDRSRNLGGYSSVGPPDYRNAPREPMGTSHGSVSTWPSNEAFNNGGFPAKNTQERMRTSAPPYTQQEPTRMSSSGFPQHMSKNTAGYPRAPGPPQDMSRNMDGFPRAPGPPQDMSRNMEGFPRASGPPQDMSRNNKGFPRAPWPPQDMSKKMDGFPRAPGPPQDMSRNMDGFPRAPGPPQDMSRNMDGLPRAPGPSQDMSRNTADYSSVRPPAPYNPAPPRAPFAPPGPRPSLPAFPNDEVTAKFFDSLKEMDATEVTATLNKITATNPAFRGINVPSLVRYLMDTGKIRPGNV